MLTIAQADYPPSYQDASHSERNMPQVARQLWPDPARESAGAENAHGHSLLTTHGSETPARNMALVPYSVALPTMGAHQPPTGTYAPNQMLDHTLPFPAYMQQMPLPGSAPSAGYGPPPAQRTASGNAQGPTRGGQVVISAELYEALMRGQTPVAPASQWISPPQDTQSGFNPEDGRPAHEPPPPQAHTPLHWQDANVRSASQALTYERPPSSFGEPSAQNTDRMDVDGQPLQTTAGVQGIYVGNEERTRPHTQ